MEQQSATAWKQSVAGITTAFIVYSIAGFIGNIIDTISFASGGLDIIWTIYDLLNGYYEPDILDTLGSMTNFFVLVGYLMFLSRLSSFSELQKTDSDKQSVSKIRSGYVLMLIASIIDFIPVLGGIIAAIVYIIAYAFLITGFKALSLSTVMHPSAKQGFEGLRSCTIILLIGNFISIIPLIGNIVDSLITLIAFFAIISDWNSIRDNGPDAEYEIHIQKAAESLKTTVEGFEDSRIAEILKSPSTYSEELVYCCEAENANREKKREEKKREEKRKIEAEEARRLREIQEEKEQERIKALWKKWRPAVFIGAAGFIALLTFMIFTSDGYHYNKGQKNLLSASNGGLEHFEKMVSKAIRHFEKIDIQHPMYSKAQHEIYTINMSYYEDSEKAANALLNAVSGNSIHIPPYVWESYANALIEGYLEPHITKNPDKGIDILLDLPVYEAKLHAGVACFKSGENYNRAYDIFCETMKDKQSTGMEDGYIGLMYLYGINGFKKNYEKAYEYLSRAPEEPEFTVHKGDLSLYLYNDHKKAKDFYEIANSQTGGEAHTKYRLEAMEHYLENNSSQESYWAKARPVSCIFDNAGIKITRNFHIYVGKFENNMLVEGIHVTPEGKRSVGKFGSDQDIYNGKVYDLHGRVIETYSMTDEEYKVRQEEQRKEIERIKSDPSYRASINAYVVGDKHKELNGIVFWVDKTHKHGKVLSLTEMVADRRYSNGKWIFYGKYKDALEWCGKLGNNWRLPTIEEYRSIHDNHSIRKAASIKNEEYWSSSPGYTDEFFTWNFKYSKRYPSRVDNNIYYARAVYEF